jgi:pimeloyl-[acyl-carrier protein] synthase
MSTPFDPTTFDPHAPAFIADPYPTYAQFREHAPAYRVTFRYGNMTLYDSTWIFRYADVKTVLEGKALFLKNTNPPSASPPPFDVLQNMPNGVFFLDPPRHDELRPILDILLAQAIAGIGASAAASATQLLDAAKASRRIELVSAYAMPLPSNALRTVLGISIGDWAGIEKWVSGMVAGHDYTAPAAAQGMRGTCAMALGAYFQALTRGCPMHAENGKMIDLMVSKAEPKGMSREEVQQTAVNLTVAGYFSTVFLIATGTLNLLRNPSQFALLRSRPDLIGNAVEEMLRYDAPAQLADRYVANDTKIAGVALKAGEQVTAVLGSANRDPDAFADADAFDITRDCKAHVGFSDGIHYCLGAPLVRQVAPVAFQTLLSSLPEFALDGIPQWQTDPYLRSVVNLPLAIG